MAIRKSSESYIGTEAGQPLRMTLSDLNNKIDEAFNAGYDKALDDLLAEFGEPDIAQIEIRNTIEQLRSKVE